MVTDPALAELYENSKPLLQTAEDHLRRMVLDALGKISNSLLVRGRIAGLRIKSLDSLARKAERNGWSPSSAISNAPDMIGARIVCPNIDDVYRVVELVKEETAFNDPPEIQDYIKHPKSSGYRAIHVNLRIDIFRRLHPHRFGCEIQVRTMLQDVWSELTHEDMYKEGSALPPDLKDRAGDLARQLAAADDIAQRIRNRVSEERLPPDLKPSLDTLSEDGLTYLFAATFGRSPAHYIVAGALEAVKTAGLNSLRPLETALQEAALRTRIENAYRKTAGWAPSPEDVFLIIPIAAAKGAKSGVKAARRAARAARNEIDEVAIRESAVALPPDFDDCVEQLRTGELDPAELARMFDTTSRCLICSEEIVLSDALEEALCDHYGVDTTGEIESVVWNSGTEVGHPDHPRLCSYHGNQADKDD